MLCDVKLIKSTDLLTDKKEDRSIDFLRLLCIEVRFYVHEYDCLFQSQFPHSTHSGFASNDGGQDTGGARSGKPVLSDIRTKSSALYLWEQILKKLDFSSQSLQSLKIQASW